MSAETDRARYAVQLIDNPLFNESLAVLKEGYVKALMACDPKDDLGRARYAFALRDLQTIRNHLNAVLVRGEMAQHEINTMQTESNPWKRAVRGLV